MTNLTLPRWTLSRGRWRDSGNDMAAMPASFWTQVKRWSSPSSGWITAGIVLMPGGDTSTCTRYWPRLISRPKRWLKWSHGSTLDTSWSSGTVKTSAADCGMTREQHSLLLHVLTRCQSRRRTQSSRTFAPTAPRSSCRGAKASGNNVAQFAGVPSHSANGTGCRYSRKDRAVMAVIDFCPARER